MDVKLGLTGSNASDIIGATNVLCCFVCLKGLVTPPVTKVDDGIHSFCSRTLQFCIIFP